MYANYYYPYTQQPQQYYQPNYAPSPYRGYGRLNMSGASYNSARSYHSGLMNNSYNSNASYQSQANASYQSLLNASYNSNASYTQPCGTPQRARRPATKRTYVKDGVQYEEYTYYESGKSITEELAAPPSRGPYKLTYFNHRSRGENVRLLLVVGGLEWEDERVLWNEFVKRRDAGELPYGQLPVLTLGDGTVNGQTMAICRYLAKETGLYPANAADALRVDAAADTAYDVSSGYQAVLLVEDAEEKEEKLQQFLEGARKTLARLEKVATESQGRFLTGKEVSYADFIFFNAIDGVQDSAEDILDDFPTLNALFSRVKALPSVAEWLENRPETRW